MTRLKAIVAELEAFNKWFAIEYPNAGSDYADRIYPIWQAAIAELRKPMSMATAIRAYNNGRNASGAESMNLLNSTQREDVRHEGGIKAVLDAAGVSYVE